MRLWLSQIHTRSKEPRGGNVDWLFVFLCAVDHLYLMNGRQLLFYLWSYDFTVCSFCTNFEGKEICFKQIIIEVMADWLL